ncbi:putative transcriptional regulatory protein [Smittium mucronatum]|uniref:Putative transcriptional regulatory protein n=1 Tax=Smittium mucronatum TaxID=133383 RepID=A0A1R0H1A5_9FUNG|nr:putative transcriptional regulatory protein [Smittium mucronatum]
MSYMKKDGSPETSVESNSNIGEKISKSSGKRPKRIQVKNACVNCQKACKRCDDGRPCLRCVKHGLSSTCTNSQRKTRQRGIKRGPYKKKEKKGLNLGGSSNADIEKSREKISLKNLIHPKDELMDPWPKKDIPTFYDHQSYGVHSSEIADAHISSNVNSSKTSSGILNKYVIKNTASRHLTSEKPQTTNFKKPPYRLDFSFISFHTNVEKPMFVKGEAMIPPRSAESLGYQTNLNKVRKRSPSTVNNVYRAKTYDVPLAEISSHEIGSKNNKSYSNNIVKNKKPFNFQLRTEDYPTDNKHIHN